jgi:hypothetical protein
MSEVTTSPAKRNGAMVPLSQPVADVMLNFIMEATSNPNVDVGKFEVLLRLKQEIVLDARKLAFIQAMNTVQAAMAPILRTMLNTVTNSKYAPLDVIDAAIRPTYTANGFSVEYNSETIDGAPWQVCEVTHTSGHSKLYRLPAPPDVSGLKGNANKTEIQGVISTVTYLRRALLCMAFNIVLTNEDNDGNRTHDTGELLSREELAELESLIAGCPAAPSVTERSLLNYFGLGALRSIKDVPADKFPTLSTALRNQQQRNPTGAAA